jgi:hypothetical protein
MTDRKRKRPRDPSSRATSTPLLTASAIGDDTLHRR